MTFESSEAINDYLRTHEEFGECILEDVVWRHFGTVVDFVFDYIWSDNGTVRTDLDQRKDLRTLTFSNVQELHVRNALGEDMCLHPEDLDWGLSEVSSVRLVNDEAVLTPYQTLPLPFHHLRCAWEGTDSRRIDIVFSTMTAH